MINIIYKGLIIGLLVSSPIGPVGLLCIQRTLYKGQKHGFFSGLGAAFSDFLYAIIACTGMGIVINFVENNKLILQISGGILLIIFGIYTFLSNPSQKLKTIEEGVKSYSYSQDTLTVFLLAFSNPSIIFLYIGLFDSFDLLLSEKDLYSMTLGLFCIFMGNLLWWFIITYLVAKLRKIFNMRRLYIMNKTIGIIIVLLAFWLISYSLIDIFNQVP